MATLYSAQQTKLFWEDLTRPRLLEETPMRELGHGQVIICQTAYK